jgi:propanediol utilization protein
MNPYDGHRLYQVQRTKTRAEILADDARRGCQAATVFRSGRALAGTPGIMALNAIRAMAAQVTAHAA